MRNQIKAIETKYRGYRFRSRLEARWAVFSDSLRLTWDYEPQGFDLGAEGWYLPDFHIRSWNRWVEVKSSEPEPGYLLKPTAFACAGNSVILIEGSPWPKEYELTLMDGTYLEDGPDIQCEFASCRRCDGICVVPQFPDDSPLIFANIGEHACGDHDSVPCGVNSGLQCAFNAARSARFEHGESP